MVSSLGLIVFAISIVAYTGWYVWDAKQMEKSHRVVKGVEFSQKD